jgi:putative ABC transport system substrate-binding protein
MPFARDDRDAKLWLDAFVQSLRNLGWSEGAKITYDVRYSEGRPDLLPALASDLVGAKSDVLVTWAAQPVDALRAATRNIPIVMAGIGDALGPGYVASLAHPGGNITGLTIVATDQTGKRLQLLQQMVSDFARVAVVWNPGASGHVFQMKDLPQAAQNLRIALQSLPVRTVGEIDSALNSSTAEKAQGIYLMEDPMIQSRRAQIVDFAIQNRLPIIGEFKPVVEAGALMSYGPDQLDLWQRAASYVDKILKGANPAELPVEQPNKYDLAINLKTAKAIGLSVPMPLTIAATEIIE